MYEEDEDSATTCPHCGEGIYDDIGQCPYCNMSISPADFRKPMPVWVVTIVILTVAGLLYATIFFR